MNGANLRLMLAFLLGMMLGVWVQPACAQQMRPMHCIQDGDGKFLVLRKALELLREKYDEIPVGIGSNAHETVVLTVSPDGTWSVVTDQGGRACMLSGGKNWRGVAPPPSESAL